MADGAFREEHVQLATGSIHLLRAGASDAPPLICLHHSIGSPGWLPLYTKLATQFDVIVPDMPGYAGSERPAWAREPRDLAIILSHMLDALKVRDVVLVGAGFGGYVAAELAAVNASRLARLVLIGAAGLKPERGEIFDQMLSSHTAYAQASFRDDAHFAEVFGEQPTADVKQLWDFSREMSARVTWKPYMFSRRLAPLLGNLALPALVIWGSEDKIVPVECAHLYGNALAGSQVEIIAGAGHCVEMEEPDRVAALITKFAETT